MSTVNTKAAKRGSSTKRNQDNVKAFAFPTRKSVKAAQKKEAPIGSITHHGITYRVGTFVADDAGWLAGYITQLNPNSSGQEPSAIVLIEGTGSMEIDLMDIRLFTEAGIGKTKKKKDASDTPKKIETTADREEEIQSITHLGIEYHVGLSVKHLSGKVHGKIRYLYAAGTGAEPFADVVESSGEVFRSVLKDLAPSKGTAKHVITDVVHDKRSKKILSLTFYGRKFEVGMMAISRPANTVLGVIQALVYNGEGHPFAWINDSAYCPDDDSDDEELAEVLLDGILPFTMWKAGDHVVSDEFGSGIVTFDTDPKTSLTQVSFEQVLMAGASAVLAHTLQEDSEAEHHETEIISPLKNPLGLSVGDEVAFKATPHKSLGIIEQFKYPECDDPTAVLADDGDWLLISELVKYIPKEKSKKIKPVRFSALPLLAGFTLTQDSPCYLKVGNTSAITTSVFRDVVIDAPYVLLADPSSPAHLGRTKVRFAKSKIVFPILPV